MSHGGVHGTPAEETTPTAVELKEVYTPAFAQDARISDVLRVLDAVIARDTTEDLSTVELLDAISALRNLIVANTTEIKYLHSLIGRLVFELIQQGIKIEDKELINELIYIK